MDITFNCNKCGETLTIDEAGAGQLVDCPKCGKPLEVPRKSKPLDNAPLRKKLCPDCGRILHASGLACVCGWDPSKPAKPRQTVASTFTEALGEILPAEMAHKEPTEASSLPACNIATVLTVIAVLEFIGALIAGLRWLAAMASVDEKNGDLYAIIFVSGIVGGIFVLGFAFALRYLHAIAYRLERNESIHRKTAK